MAKDIDKIVDLLLSLHKKGDPEICEEIEHSIAFNFPSFVLVSPKKWKELKIVYEKLAMSENSPVRISIAASFHEVYKLVSKIQNKVAYEIEMIGVFFKMVKDIDEVKARVFHHLPKVMPYLSELAKSKVYDLVLT